MNKKMTNNLYRLETMITLLGSGGATINSLSELMDVPKTTLYDDIITVMTDTGSRLMLTPVEEDYWDEFDVSGKEQISVFTKNIKSGKYDDLEIYIDVPYTDKIEVVLTSDEMDALRDFMKEREKGDTPQMLSYLVKNSNSGYTERDIELSNFITESIEDGQSLTITYVPVKTPDKTLTKTIRPIRIVHNTEDDFVYVCDHNGWFYRFDRIIDYKPSDETLEISEDIDYRKFDKMWGVNISEDYTHVRIKIFDEADVINRVKKDLGQKLNEDTFSYNEEDGYAIYEDDIVGVGSFMSWVYSYGSSIVILAPEELVKRAVESIKAREEYYNL